MCKEGLTLEEEKIKEKGNEAIFKMERPQPNWEYLGTWEKLLSDPKIFLSDPTQKAHSQTQFHNYFHNSSIHLPSLNSTQMTQSIPNKNFLVFSAHDPHILTQKHLQTQLGFDVHLILTQSIIWPISKPTEEIKIQPQLDFHHTYKADFYSFYEKSAYSLTTEFFFTILVLGLISGNHRIGILLMLDIPRCLHLTSLLFCFYLHFQFKTRDKFLFKG